VKFAASGDLRVLSRERSMKMEVVTEMDQEMEIMEIVQVTEGERVKSNVWKWKKTMKFWSNHYCKDSELMRDRIQI